MDDEAFQSSRCVFSSARILFYGCSSWGLIPETPFGYGPDYIMVLNVPAAAVTMARYCVLAIFTHLSAFTCLLKNNTKRS